MKIKNSLLVLLLVASSQLGIGQITLIGTSYSENFNSLGSGLSTGWSVTTSATTSTLGTTAEFTSATTSWGTTDVGTDFRNISSNNIPYTGVSATQNANSDRALGLRPVGGSSSEVTPGRNGALTLAIANTTGFENFSLSVDIFTVNITGSTQLYQLEYRIGNSGDFTILSSYNTPSTSTNDFGNVTTLTASSVTLSAMNDQADTVYIRLRGNNSAGSTNLDQIGIDNFSLNFAISAVPEPSTYAALLGLGALGFVASRRRGRNAVALAA